MSAQALSITASSDLSAILGKANGRQALAQIVGIVTHPAFRSHVAIIATSMIEKSRSGGSILVDPSQIAEGCKGALEVAIKALHRLPADAPALQESFAGSMQDLAELPDDILLNRYLPPPGDWLHDPRPFLNAWLRSNSNVHGKPIYSLDEKLGIDRAQLAHLLERIQDDEEARSLIHGGRLGDALRLGRPIGDLTEQDSVSLVKGFARVLAVVVAHLRTALLRRWARTPMTELVSHSHDRQTLARCMMASVVAPAKAMTPIFALSDGPASMAELSTYLAGTPLADTAFLSLIEAVAASSPRPGNARHGFDDNMARLQAEIWEKSNKVAKTRKKTLVDVDHLGNMSFVFDRLGLTPSHGTVLIARSLLETPLVIDACVSAVLAGKCLPDPPTQSFIAPVGYEGVRPLMLATDHLRRHVMPDRESEKMGIWKHNNKSGCDMIVRALQAFEAEHPERAIAALWIDPRAWFQ